RPLQRPGHRRGEDHHRTHTGRLHLRSRLGSDLHPASGGPRVTMIEPITAVQGGERTVDPGTISTIWHARQRTRREMRHLLYRTGQSPAITQSKDVSTGIWDAVGMTLAIPAGITPHFLGGKYSVEYVNQEYAGEIYPGDVFLSNDPYRGYTAH